MKLVRSRTLDFSTVSSTRSFSGPRFEDGEVARWTPKRDEWNPPEFRSFLGLREIFRLKHSVYVAAMPRSLIAVAIAAGVKVLEQHEYVDVIGGVRVPGFYLHPGFCYGFSSEFGLQPVVGRAVLGGADEQQMV